MYIESDLDPIPSEHREALELACALPASARAGLDRLIQSDYKKHRRRSLFRPGGWKRTSEYGVFIPTEPTSDEHFIIKFECAWDEEHGREVVFDATGVARSIDLQ